MFSNLEGVTFMEITELNKVGNKHKLFMASDS